MELKLKRPLGRKPEIKELTRAKTKDQNQIQTRPKAFSLWSDLALFGLVWHRYQISVRVVQGSWGYAGRRNKKARV